LLHGYSSPWLSATADCSTATEGSAVLNAKLLSEIVRSMPDGLVNITVDDTTAIIRCGKA
jgi:DNA polymerase III sliding clamp (beta) subunit (PCNA family)